MNAATAQESPDDVLPGFVRLNARLYARNGARRRRRPPPPPPLLSLLHPQSLRPRNIVLQMLAALGLLTSI